MAENLQPDGGEVRIDDVSVSSPGLTGQVAVHYPATEGARGAELAHHELGPALDRSHLYEQLTVEIIDPLEAPELAGGQSRSTPDGEPGLAVEVPGPGTGLGQVVLAADENGALSWHFPTDIGPGEVADRGADRRTYTIRRARAPLTEDTAQDRGLLGAIGTKLLKVLVFPLLEPVIGRVGDHFVGRWESTHRPPALRRVTADGISTTPDGSRPDWAALGVGRVLLLIHGTASTSVGCFHSLPPAWLGHVTRRYGGRVLAFDHPTLSVDPTENARSLVAQIPPGVRLDADVLAHSRGGLVARTLVERADLLGPHARRLGLHTIVMAGTPNAGTVLADPDRLGAWVDRVTNLLQLVPDNPVTDVLDIVIAVVKQLAVGALKGLEGLMSMRPGSEFLRQLNRAGQHTTTYRALAADYDPPKGSTLLSSARNGVTDVVFGLTHNDLVVPQRGVFDRNGAPGFPISVREVFVAADAVDHSGYWRHSRALAALDRWLVG